MTLPKSIKNRLLDFDAVIDDNRFSILVALRSTDILELGEHSCTPTQLSKITSISPQNLQHHIKFLMERKLVSKKKYGNKKVTYYHIKEKGVGLLNIVGISERKIKEMNKRITK